MVGLKGFEMPKSCVSCPMLYIDRANDCYWCNLGANHGRSFVDDKKQDDCPLVEVKVVEDGTDKSNK